MRPPKPSLRKNKPTRRGKPGSYKLRLTLLVDPKKNGKPTIIIANYSPAALEAHLGPAIVSRIHLCGTIITCDWQSYREINYHPRK
ncbi:hypothetical protein [Akkermansia sp. BCRC 18949]|uniref:hypothetical protein n=1 Tax=Akkermansia sp. BCRC 18949 TaxID=3037987 RepID=UPI00384B9CD7